MKRVGILTFHHVNNYGAVLQAWAIADVVRSLGHKTEILDYRPQVGPSPLRRGWRRLAPSLGHFKSQRFVSLNTPLSKKRFQDISTLEYYIDQNDFDALICGSDQVWQIHDYLGVNPAYFLGVGSSAKLKRISYAPSTGSSSSFGGYSREVRPMLERFDAISVRDHHTQAAIEELNIRVDAHVVDPTLIADLQPLISKADANKEIVVIGKIDNNADKFIKSISNKIKSPVRAVATRCNSANIQRPFASPKEWVSAIANARFVITSFFHGAALSLALRKPFIALDCAGRRVKIQDLCDTFGIPERLLIAGSDGYVVNPDLLQTPYDKGLNAKLDTRAAESRAFLKAALDG